MNKTLGAAIAIGVIVNPTVALAFATGEQKIRASQGKMLELTKKAKVPGTVEAAKQRVMVTQKIDGF
ncbi:MAG: hypothetical protein HDQ91_02785 [Desulfovibrio sp.]|nr:hypothetical protein [Desulfovibrio sp.]